MTRMSRAGRAFEHPVAHFVNAARIPRRGRLRCLVKMRLLAGAVQAKLDDFEVPMLCRHEQGRRRVLVLANSTQGRLGGLLVAFMVINQQHGAAREHTTTNLLLLLLLHGWPDGNDIVLIMPSYSSLTSCVIVSIFITINVPPLVQRALTSLSLPVPTFPRNTCIFWRSIRCITK